MTQISEPNTPEQPISPAVDLAPIAPVTETERLGSLDVLRGFAVLGILAINIQQMALPQSAMMNPSILGDLGLIDKLAWSGVFVLFLQKFMSIFGMLFGAGIIVMWMRAEAAGRPATPLHYRRMAWLLGIGFVHAYLFWWGDILFSYAICGMLVYLLCRLSPRRLLIVGAIVFIVPAPFVAGISGFIGNLHERAAVAQTKAEAGEPLTPEDRSARDAWQSIGGAMQPAPEQVQSEIAAHTGSYGKLFVHRALNALLFQTLILIAFAGWRICGLMLIGMALMKWRVLAAERSRALYLRMVLFGLGLGLPLDIFGVSYLMSNAFAPGAQMLTGAVLNYLASVGSAIGYIGIVMLVFQTGMFAGLKARLAAVGRMALTSYLTHTIVFTTLFYGYGFGLFGSVALPVQLLLVLAMWLAQLYVSPIWLRSFRFGPVEWLWRSLTYRKGQPFRRSTTCVEPAVP